MSSPATSELTLDKKNLTHTKAMSSPATSELTLDKKNLTHTKTMSSPATSELTLDKKNLTHTKAMSSPATSELHLDKESLLVLHRSMEGAPLRDPPSEDKPTFGGQAHLRRTSPPSALCAGQAPPYGASGGQLINY